MMKNIIVPVTFAYLASQFFSGCSGKEERIVVENNVRQIEIGREGRDYETADTMFNWSKNSEPRPKYIKVNKVIFHCTEKIDYIPNYRKNPEKNLIACINEIEKTGFSYHFVIGRDGSYVKTVDPSNIAYHCGISMDKDGEINLNRNSVGICAIGTSTSNYPEEVYITWGRLCARLDKEPGQKKNSCMQPPLQYKGHEEVAGKELVKLKVRDFAKSDPGIKTGKFDFGKFIKYYTYYMNHQGDLGD